MTFPRNFKSKVLSAYQWLVENYQDGDRIFLFGENCAYFPAIVTSLIIASYSAGFSRGAYQVRVIAGMLHLVSSSLFTVQLPLEN